MLRVRVYPDDVSMSHHDPALTPLEAQVADDYWRDPGPEAWRRVQEALRPARAAWAVRASRPGAPPRVVRPTDPATVPPRPVTMPGRWRFVGIVGGEIVVDKLGRVVPDDLTVGLLREEESWETDWFSALVAGMAVELVLPQEVDALDELVVLGVRDDDAETGAARLGDLLLGHAFAGGLGLLPAGTPTNNTAQARSGWSSAPAFPGPDPDDPKGPRPAADALAAALDLPRSVALRESAGAEDDESDAVAALTLLTWPTLGAAFADAAATHWDLASRTERAVGPTRQWRTIRDHAVAHVRSRGPLPTLRVGRQPYGVLPVTCLDDWRSGDGAGELLSPWLTRLRELWRSVVLAEDSTVPRMRPDQPVDQVAVDALTRLPVALGLEMWRMQPPTHVIANTSLDEQPTAYGIGGLAPDGTLRWSERSDGFTDLGVGFDDRSGLPLFVDRIAPDPTAFPARASATADYLAPCGGSWPGRSPRRTTTATGRCRCPRARSSHHDAAPSSTCPPSTYRFPSRRPRTRRGTPHRDRSPMPRGCWTPWCSCPTGRCRAGTTARTTRCARRCRSPPTPTSWWPTSWRT